MIEKASHRRESLADEARKCVALRKAGLKALDVLGTFDSLETALLVLKIAPVSTIIHQVNLRLNLECLELQALAILAEDL